VKELATGVYSLGHGKAGHVHAFLLETGNELSLVDTLFENDARLVLDACNAWGAPQPTSSGSRSRMRTARISAALRA
jgi:hypothetical protein